jgi:hypothetical protein
LLLPAGAGAQNPPPPTRDECFSLHENGQVLRKKAALLESRQALRRCSDEVCPALVREDCVALLADVERGVPTVVFEVVVDGQEQANPRVFEGGQLLTDGLRGVPHVLNPGVHKFRAEVPARPPIESTEVIREGEQNRVIRLEYTTPAAAVVVREQPTGPRPIPAVTWVFSGLSVAALAAGSAFGALALSKRSQLTCQPLCTDAELSPTRTMSQVADASFGGAIVFAGLASYFFFTRPVVPTPGEQRLEVKATAFVGPGYEGVGVQGSF